MLQAATLRSSKETKYKLMESFFFNWRPGIQYLLVAQLEEVSMKQMDRPSVTEMDNGGVYEMDRQTK